MPVMQDGTEVKAGPEITAEVTEVQAAFATDAALQEALALLAQARFDRADLSLPQAAPSANEATPDQGAALPTSNTDVRQARTLGTSMAGTIGAFAAAGATIATGGAAGLAIAAAAAVGVGAAAGAHAVGDAAEGAQTETRDDAAGKGELLLSARVTTPERKALAEQLMRQAGGRAVEVVTRDAQGVSHVQGQVNAGGWTG